MGQIHDSILSCVGKTPVVRMQHVARDVPPDVFGKCEFLNPGGSVKDRIGVHMLEDARWHCHPGKPNRNANAGSEPEPNLNGARPNHHPDVYRHLDLGSHSPPHRTHAQHLSRAGIPRPSLRHVRL